MSEKKYTTEFTSTQIKILMYMFNCTFKGNINDLLDQIPGLSKGELRKQIHDLNNIIQVLNGYSYIDEDETIKFNTKDLPKLKQDAIIGDLTDLEDEE